MSDEGEILMPTDQDGIRALRKKLKAEKKEIEKKMSTLIHWCEHPNMDNGEWLGRKGWQECPDCGYWREWWL